MRSRRARWLAFLVTIAVGLGVGLYYGWVVSPVKYVDVAPNTLRADYRADFVLMVAEAYQADHDLNAARRALTLLGRSPEEAVAQALQFGEAHGYTAQDLYVLRALQTALQARPVESTP